PFLAHLRAIWLAPWCEKFNPALDHTGKRIVLLVAARVRRQCGSFGEDSIGGVDSLIERCTHQPSEHTSLNSGTAMGSSSNGCAVPEQILHDIDARCCRPEVELRHADMIEAMRLEGIAHTVLHPSPPTKTLVPGGKSRGRELPVGAGFQPECCRNQSAKSAASARLWSSLRERRWA